ncbi:hypothetical protein M514_05161 [Trichuris suis]|uniref:Uncharacterized protein n=1 Tax=Trichuris suis TaxID=68888 RepID=A0A085M9J8_9BILA|nr:hypothetical protein M513_05161 [Trichuris suis]KFD62758.1 hypothetical protein M514_05161 [Trichuris suis]
MVKYANLMKAELSWLGFEEMEYQDVKDILNCQQDELITDKLQGKQKEGKKQMMMNICWINAIFQAGTPTEREARIV